MVYFWDLVFVVVVVDVMLVCGDIDGVLICYEVLFKCNFDVIFFINNVVFLCSKVGKLGV